MARITKATLLAAVLSGLVAPIVWPFVILRIDGAWPTWSIYPMAALAISAFTVIISAPCCIVIGGTALFFLETHNFNAPIITGTLGLISSLVIFFLVGAGNNYPSLSQSWPLAAFFAVFGVFCGVAASLLSRTNE